MTDWLTAIGTIGAVIIALVIAIFHEHLRRLRWHPTLEILLENRPPDCHLTTLTNLRTGMQAACYYFRIRILNKGNVSAETVEVFVEEVYRRRADGSFEKWREFLPLNLVWANYGKPYFPKIAPQIYKHCDLGHIIDPNLRQEFPGEDSPAVDVSQAQTIMCLEFVVRPNTGTYILAPAFYKLVLVAAAANAKLTRRTIELNLTGHWFPDETRMLRDGVGVRVL